ncbi:hypothetical protein CBL_00226 [Carabus blaptoides fortunei]
MSNTIQPVQVTKLLVIALDVDYRAFAQGATPQRGTVDIPSFDVIVCSLHLTFDFKETLTREWEMASRVIMFCDSCHSVFCPTSPNPYFMVPSIYEVLELSKVKPVHDLNASRPVADSQKNLLSVVIQSSFVDIAAHNDAVNSTENRGGDIVSTASYRSAQVENFVSLNNYVQMVVLSSLDRRGSGCCLRSDPIVLYLRAPDTRCPVPLPPALVLVFVVSRWMNRSSHYDGQSINQQS